MLTLLKNLICYAPELKGKNDILLAGDRIYKILPSIKENDFIENVYDFEGCLAFPGIIDLHVHITGGGGEEGFKSSIAGIDINDIFSAGVTTVVGILGADNKIKSIEALYAKAKALEEESLTTYIYSGSYSLPPVTITGELIKDIVFIDKVIGIGEIALSDHRGSQADLKELLKISSDVHLGGMLANKAGIVHFHMGDGKKGLEPVTEIIENSDLPIEMFLPTHINRNKNKKLFEQGIKHIYKGGNIDLTAGEITGIAVPEAVSELISIKADLSKVTVSSDANGSTPDKKEAGKIISLFTDIKELITKYNIIPETAFSLVTLNAAKRLKIYPRKGVLREGSDADILITDINYNIKQLFCMGKGKIKTE